MTGFRSALSSQSRSTMKLWSSVCVSNWLTVPLAPWKSLGAAVSLKLPDGFMRYSEADCATVRDCFERFESFWLFAITSCWPSGRVLCFQITKRQSRVDKQVDKWVRQTCHSRVLTLAEASNLVVQVITNSHTSQQAKPSVEHSPLGTDKRL